MIDIFTHFIARSGSVDGDRRTAYAQWFVDNIPSTEFESDERLFREFLEYCSGLSIPITYRYLQVWLDTELRELLHKSNIRVKGCETLSFDDPVSFETVYKTTCQVLLDDFKVLSSMESDLDDFKVNMSKYFKEQRQSRLTNALAKTFDILNDTSSSEEAADYIVDTVNSINEIYDTENLQDLDGPELLSVDYNQMVKITDSGLPAIDKDSEGLYSTQLFGIEAQSGVGKTRFVLGTFVYRALTVYKKNVMFMALEQKEAEVRAMLIACHVFHMFNVQINDKMILTNNLPDEVRSYYEAAKYDLFESGKYGKFFCKEIDLYVETFVTKLRTYDKLNGPFHLICIDYMGLIESKPANYRRQLEEYEIIKSAFKQFKRYLRHTGKAGIAISQFNREGIAAGKADKEITQEMAQGGLNVYRNTDYNIAMSRTDTMRLQQKCRFSQPKVRSSAGFPRFVANTRLGFCYFAQEVKKAV